ncbi:dihaem cytochrome c [Geobacter sp. OR-1]|uniref:diheme cytochrome c n=1 Tax=Geobacter sp. OR-1 TaxID=1266765 RepID=UPI000542CE9F|nr:diheme cytochrome c [Geobacter sp. OR-1]GAM09496.1 dihaem cytochrome c [Geobacter sp. OR-1]
MATLTRIVFAAVSVIISASVVAAAEDHRDGRSGIMSGATSKAYLKECGSCHLAYQPQFLPKRSWEKIINSLDRHFGDDAALDAQTRTEILNYAVTNSAETSSAKISRKMLASLGNADTPLRISDTPYFKRKHREVRPEIFTRKSVGSPANCLACHPAAEKGDYDEHKVKIPRK